MQVDIITLFPEMFLGPFDHSIVKRAQDKGKIHIGIHNLRDWGIDKRGTVDGRPYGGGVGMILRIEPIYYALQEVKNMDLNSKIVLTDPRGIKFTQSKAKEYSKLDKLIIICGHYEGIDERVREYLVDESVSIGDFVLTGGELPAMIITDAVTRLLPGVLKKPEATVFESFSGETLDARSQASDYEYPQYTRPEEFQGWKVPEVLLSGNHGEIKKWRGDKSKNST